MLEVRRADQIHYERGGWFDARWHFSFDRYRDPRQMGIGPLRVFNDDRLVAGADWPMHPHADVEGCTYVVGGLFRHADSLGNDGVLEPGGVQRMTLGSGAYHSERNGSTSEPMRFLQFWILPDTPSLPPSNEQRRFTRDDRHNKLRRVLRPAQAIDDGDRSIPLHQDASTYVGSLDPDIEVAHEFAEPRAGYLYLIEGALTLGETALSTGDALKILGPERVALRASRPSELILIDVPTRYTPVGVWARDRARH